MKKQITIEETKVWLDKLEALGSNGAKLLHIRKLLQKNSLVEPKARAEGMRLYDNGVFIGYIASSEVVKRMLKIGFIKLVEGFPKIYETKIIIKKLTHYGETKPK